MAGYSKHHLDWVVTHETLTHTSVTASGADRKQNPYVQNGSVAVVTAWREEAVVVLFTVRLAVSLKEVFGADFLLTVSTHEMLRMPCTPHCCHHLNESKKTRTEVYDFTNNKRHI